MKQETTAYRPRPRQLPIAFEGLPYLAIAILLTLVSYFLGLTVVTLVLLAASLFVAFFFRNPSRFPPKGDGFVVSPADGRVLFVKEGVAAPVTGEGSTVVAIFMSVFSVHVNRFPVGAVLKKSVYHPGKFLVASLDKASADNERNTLVLEDSSARRYVMVQIAGMVARRIVCYLREGDSLKIGEHFGMIRFGSRVDLYLPPEVLVSVKKGDHVRAGQSVIGRFR